MEKRGRVGMNDPPLVAATWKKWHLTDFECSRVRITLDTTRLWEFPSIPSPLPFDDTIR